MNNFIKTTLLTQDQKVKFTHALEEALLYINENEETDVNCNHSFEKAEKALRNTDIKESRIRKFLQFCEENGGHCDCEIIYNVVLAGYNYYD